MYIRLYYICHYLIWIETYTRGKQTKLELISSRFAFCFTIRTHLFHVLRARNIYYIVYIHMYIESAQTRSIRTFIIIAIIIIIIKTAMTKCVLIIIIIIIIFNFTLIIIIYYLYNLIYIARLICLYNIIIIWVRNRLMSRAAVTRSYIIILLN